MCIRDRKSLCIRVVQLDERVERALQRVRDLLRSVGRDELLTHAAGSLRPRGHGCLGRSGFRRRQIQQPTNASSHASAGRRPLPCVTTQEQPEPLSPPLAVVPPLPAPPEPPVIPPPPSPDAEV